MLLNASITNAFMGAQLFLRVRKVPPKTTVGKGSYPQDIVFRSIHGRYLLLLSVPQQHCVVAQNLGVGLIFYFWG